MALRCGQDGRDSQREVSNSERFRRLGSIGLRLGGRGSGSGPVLGALLHIQYFTTLERFLSVIGRRRRTMWRIPRTSQHSLAGLVALWRCGALLGKRTDSFIRSASSRSIRCKVCMLCVYECRCMYACLLPHPFSRYRRKSLSAFYMQGLHRPHRLRRFARPAGRRALAAGGAGWPWLQRQILTACLS